MGVSQVVLIVEDEFLVREAIAFTLEAEGWEVLVASHGEGAIALLEAPAAHIDVLFTDIQLGGFLSGWDVADAFCRERPDIAVIYTSANATQTSRQVPGSVFIDKPYAAAQIVSACRKVMP